MARTNRRRQSELLIRCIPMLRGYVRHLVRSREAAHDVLQEVILSILTNSSAPDDTARFATWSRGIARAVASKGGALQSELPWDDESEDPADPLENPERAADTRETLQRAVHGLSEESVRLLVRRYVWEENAEELARQLEKTPSSLRVRLMRLRSAARSVKMG